MGLFDFLRASFGAMPTALTLIATLAVVFVNGWTDAPNAIASCVSTGCLSMRKAVILASISNFAGRFADEGDRGKGFGDGDQYGGFRAATLRLLSPLCAPG